MKSFLVTFVLAALVLFGSLAALIGMLAFYVYLFGDDGGVLMFCVVLLVGCSAFIAYERTHS